jgi:uncharacterized membrane protein
VVHFSVAFLVTGGLCEALGILRGREPLERFGGTLVLAGTASLLPAVISGFLAEFSITIPAGAAGSVSLHQRLGLATFALFLVGLFWKAWGRGQLPAGQRLPYALLLLVGVVLVIAGAATGGHMVYRLAVGIE